MLLLNGLLLMHLHVRNGQSVCLMKSPWQQRGRFAHNCRAEAKAKGDYEFICFISEIIY